MNFDLVSREESLELQNKFWNLEYPDFLKSKEETKAITAVTIEGTYERYWLMQHGGTSVGIIIAVDPNGHPSPIHLDVEMLLDPKFEDECWSEMVSFALSKASDAGAKEINIWIKGIRRSRAAYLLTKQYQLAQTVPVTRLDIQQFDGSRFEHKFSNIEEQGISIKTVSKLEAEGFDWIPQLYDATKEMLDDMPHDHPPTHVPLKQFTLMFKNPVIYNYDLMFAAMHNDQIIGYSRVTPSVAMPKLVSTGLSGVIRAFRRAGVVTCLKVTGINALKEMGYDWVQTENDETNPMYQLNLILGFKRIWDWERYKLTL